MIRNQLGMLVFGGNNTTGPIDVATACNAHGGSGRMDFDTETFVAHTLRGKGFDASEDGTGRGTPLVPVAAFNETGRGWWNEAQTSQTVRKGDLHGNGGARESTLIAFSCKDHGADAAELSPTLRAMEFDSSHANAGGQVAVCFESRVARNGRGGPSDSVPPLKAQSGSTGRGDAAPLLAVNGAAAVRRLTPRECERLQGFPDDYTLVPHRGKPAADGPRYRAIGNSMAVPVMRWIGRRIQMVDSIGG